MSITTIILALLGWMTMFLEKIPFWRELTFASKIATVPQTVFIIAIFIAIFHEIYYRDFFHEFTPTAKSILNFLLEIIVDIGSFILVWNCFFVIEYIWAGVITICKDINWQLPEITETAKLAIAIIVESNVAAKGLGKSFLSKPYYLLIATLGIVSFILNQEQYISFWCMGIATIVAFAGELIVRGGKFCWRMIVDLAIDIGAYLIMYQYITGALFLAISKIFTELPADYGNWTRTIQILISVLFELAIIFEFEYVTDTEKSE